MSAKQYVVGRQSCAIFHMPPVARCKSEFDAKRIARLLNDDAQDSESRRVALLEGEQQ